MSSNPTRVPSYRKRSGYDQAIVTLTDAVTKRRKDYWLGPFDSPASRERYHRLIAEWEARGRRLPEPEAAGACGANGANGSSGNGCATVDDVIERFWRWAGTHYAGRERDTFRPVLRLLRRMDGTTPAASYGPRRLRLIREAMIRGDAEADPPREPWSRPYINSQVKRIRRLFKWAASHEIVPVSVPQALATVESLKRGRTSARETEKVRPADMAIVEGARECMCRPVRALVDLQLLTGARPGELLGMRAVDLDMDGPGGVWVYRPERHKNAHRDQERAIYLGPKAQRVIRPLLLGRGPGRRCSALLTRTPSAARRGRRRGRRRFLAGTGPGRTAPRRAGRASATRRSRTTDRSGTRATRPSRPRRRWPSATARPRLNGRHA